jgi:hypothetical protein
MMMAAYRVFLAFRIQGEQQPVLVHVLANWTALFLILISEEHKEWIHQVSTWQ